MSDTRRVITTLNVTFTPEGVWTGSVTSWEQSLNKKSGYYENIKDTDEYTDIIHIGDRQFAFADLDGEQHTVDLAPHRAKINELFAKLRPVQDETLTTKNGQLQWHLDTTADHPENSIVTVAGKFNVRIHCVLTKWPGDKKRQTKFLCSIWRRAIQAVDEDFEF